MQIHEKSEGDLLELTVTGVLDNESSMHFRKAIDDHVRDGWHRILVHMQGVSYISSAGVGALVSAKKRLAQLEGLFGICGLTPEVERVLSLVRVLDGLVCDPQQARASVSVGDYTRSLSVRIARADGLDLEVYTLEGNHSLACQVMGDPRPIFESTFTEQNCRTVEFSDQSFALGLGALGGDFGSACPRFGEFLAVAGAVTHSAQSRPGLPDYSQSQGEFTPRAQVLYGIQCEGGFSHLIRFHPVEADEPVGLSAIVAQCLRQSGWSLAGVVILAESAGLLGVHLRRSPAAASVSEVQRFRFPELREWLSFSPERVYSRHLTLIVGVAKTAGMDQSSPSLDAMLRPIDADGDLCGHFHAAVFPYHPLKKRTLDLYASVRLLFQSGSIQDVLHLVRDDRPIVGAGESELLGGACWVSPISDIVSGERNR
jgi:anti-anti-sigma factor